jgi:hypothetical protein
MLELRRRGPVERDLDSILDVLNSLVGTEIWGDTKMRAVDHSI